MNALENVQLQNIQWVLLNFTLCFVLNMTSPTRRTGWLNGMKLKRFWGSFLFFGAGQDNFTVSTPISSKKLLDHNLYFVIQDNKNPNIFYATTGKEKEDGHCIRRLNLASGICNGKRGQQLLDANNGIGRCSELCVHLHFILLQLQNAHPGKVLIEAL